MWTIERSSYEQSNSYDTHILCMRRTHIQIVCSLYDHLSLYVCPSIRFCVHVLILFVNVFFFLWDRCRSYFLPKSSSNINLNCKYNKFRSYMRIWMWMDYYFWWNTHVIRTFNTNYKNFWKEQETQWMEAKMYEWININMYEKIYERERVSGIWERWSQHMINMSFIVT